MQFERTSHLIELLVIVISLPVLKTATNSTGILFIDLVIFYEVNQDIGQS